MRERLLVEIQSLLFCKRPMALQACYLTYSIVFRRAFSQASTNFLFIQMRSNESGFIIVMTMTHSSAYIWGPNMLAYRPSRGTPL